MHVPANSPEAVFRLNQTEYEAKAIEVLRSGRYILGEETRSFERGFSAFLGGGTTVGVASGLDALTIALHVLGVGPGDEVILQGNTYIATALAVSRCGAVPVFTDPDERFFMSPKNVAAAITPRTRAVLVTHLYGMMTPMDGLTSLAASAGLLLLEDCAQAHGCRWRGKKAGLFGDAGCFSFYPTKNLGAFGDGGAVVTKDETAAERMRAYRNYGSEKKYHNAEIGVNSRLDELQAGLLNVKLGHLDELNAIKRGIAERYLKELDNPAVILPAVIPGAENVWHQFVVRTAERDALRRHLAGRGIDTDIHYPIPPHLSGAYAFLGLGRGSLPVAEKLADTVLSLPSFVGMTGAEISAVVDAVNSFPG